jgi:hypothetical protein
MYDKYIQTFEEPSLKSYQSTIEGDIVLLDVGLNTP